MLFKEAFEQFKTANCSEKNNFTTSPFKETLKTVYLDKNKSFLIKPLSDSDKVIKKIFEEMVKKNQNDNLNNFILDLSHLNCLNALKIAAITGANVTTFSTKININILVNDSQTKTIIEKLNPGNLKINLIDKNKLILLSA